MTTQEARSFGVIPILRDKKGGFEILIVKNKNGDHWGLPKGTPEVGERPIETAKRELEEETGIKDVEIQPQPVFEEKYSFNLNGTTINKTNSYFICFVREKISAKVAEDIEETKWIRIEDADNELTHDESRKVASELGNYLEKRV